jgi:hypothetical protein
MPKPGYEITDKLAKEDSAADKDLIKKPVMAAINAIKPKQLKKDTGETTNPAGDTYKKGGKIRGDGIAQRGKTKGTIR